MQHPQLALGSEENLRTGLTPPAASTAEFQLRLRSLDIRVAPRLPPPPLPCGPNEDFDPAPAEVSRTRVRWPEAAGTPSCLPCGRFRAAEARAPFRARCVRQAGRRTRFTRALPRSDPLGHLLSRDGHDTGWRTDIAGLELGRSLAADLPSRRTGSTLAKSVELVGPSARPARADRPRLASRCKREASRTEPDRRAPLTWTAQPRSARLGDRVARTTRPPGAEGRLTRPPRRETRSAAPEVPSIEALPSSATLGFRREPLPRRVHACMRPSRPEPALASPPGQGVLHSFSPACGEHTMPFSSVDYRPP